MQSKKWFYFSKVNILFLVLFVSLVSFAEAQVQKEYEHTVAKGETLYKLSYIYNVAVDSIKDWNNLETGDIEIGKKLLIKNYNKATNYEVELYKIKYNINLKTKEKLENEASFDVKFKNLEKQKLDINEADPNSIFKYMEISKSKKLLEDSLAALNKRSNIVINYLNIDKKRFEETIEKKKQENVAKEKALLVVKDTPVVPKKLIVVPIKEESDPIVVEKLEEIEEKVKEKKEKSKPVKLKEEKIKPEKVKVEKVAKQKPEKEKTIVKEKKSKSKKEKTETEKSPKKENEIEDNDSDPDVLIFDVDFDAKQDTTSKKYKKQQAKLEKEFNAELDSSKAVKNVMVDEVSVKSKKKTKFKLGDDVGALRQEKAKFFLSRAKLEIDKSNYKKAHEFINKSLEINPSLADAYMLKGDMLASLSYYDKAIQQYQKANYLNDQIPQLHYNIGNCLIFLGKREKALEKMSDAIAVDSNYVLAYLGRSSIYVDLGLYKGALYDYKKILSINKYFYPALKGKGIANMKIGNYDEAIRDFNQLIEYDSNDPSIYYNRGMSKMYLSEIYGACMDFLSASEMGYSEANKAINKYCD